MRRLRSFGGGSGVSTSNLSRLSRLMTTNLCWAIRDSGSVATRDESGPSHGFGYRRPRVSGSHGSLWRARSQLVGTNWIVAFRRRTSMFGYSRRAVCTCSKIASVTRNADGPARQSQPQRRVHARIVFRLAFGGSGSNDSRNANCSERNQHTGTRRLNRPSSGGAFPRIRRESLRCSMIGSGCSGSCS